MDAQKDSKCFFYKLRVGPGLFIELAPVWVDCRCWHHLTCRSCKLNSCFLNYPFLEKIQWNSNLWITNLKWEYHGCKTLFTELEDQQVSSSYNIYSGTKHIPLFSHFLFTSEFVSLFFATFFLVLIQTQYLYSSE